MGDENEDWRMKELRIHLWQAAKWAVDINLPLATFEQELRRAVKEMLARKAPF